ncbi:hypothetical protein PLICRDRAFT_97961 [Plicaturopsis crispa FD-325 SS-3]|nr:hypothetical protein PLICRDRAFT_97961 [Plicaturopsis crispa FD-325 SS-3]
MSSKTPVDNADSFTTPPSISQSDILLASTITLPSHPHVAYATFTSNNDDAVERARRLIFSGSQGRAILDSLLPSIHTSKDVSTFFVFAITSPKQIGDRYAALTALKFDEVDRIEIAAFTPQDLYPCSSECSNERMPCPNCLAPLPSSSKSADCHLPRKPLRRVYSHFLEAVRNRLVDDIVQASLKKPNTRQVKRYKGGFLLGPPPSLSEWGTGWEHHVQTRPLIHCHLELHLTPSRIIIHPILRPTHFRSLSISLPLPPGTPISLLPHGVPAYFLTTFTGPTSALTSQFELSLAGLGSGNWQTVPASHELSAEARADASIRKGPMYIIAWIGVQNKQGEDKGVTVVWPARLAVSYLPSSPSQHANKPLSYIPELPTQLQPSPPPPPPPSVPVTSPASADASSPLSEVSQQTLTRPISRRTCTSPTSDSIRAFRTLTLGSSRDIPTVATEVGSYVDSVAKERERELDRIRRERDSAHASASPRTLPTPGTNTPGPSSGLVRTPGQFVPQNPPIAPSLLPLHLPGTSVSNIQHSIPPGQQFYPSPPSNPPSNVSLQADANVFSSEVVDPLPPPSAPISVPAAPPGSSSFDPFATLDSTWSDSNNDFMNMDYNMDFGMSIDPIPGAENGGGDRMNTEYDEDFGGFTDDDFSFFDRPRPSIPPPMDHSIGARSGLTPVATSFSPPLFGDGGHMPGPGPGPPSSTPGYLQPSPWAQSDLFSPQVRVGDGTPYMHDGLPPSPTKTSSSHSAPATPNVQLSGDHGVLERLHARHFDAIPFAPSHRIADGKYAVGKFALPSPPDEEDRTEPIPSVSFPGRSGWRSKYSAATDPRIGVVYKLIGVKRKSFDQGSRETKLSPAWIREHEDWKSTADVAEDGDDSKSEAESEDEDEAEEVSPMISRPSTPLPSYLPKGPSLLHTHFHHSKLLALSSLLRPPDAAVAPTNMAAAAPPVSVPTPVSPAAQLGAASEKSKSLEAAAQIVASEIVENGVWADAWRSNVPGPAATKPVSEVWPTDVKLVARLLEEVPSIEASLDAEALFNLCPPTSSDRSNADNVLLPLEPPLISIAKSDAIIQVLPSALRFWEKLGLGPRAGKKNITAFAFFENEGEERQQQVGTWLSAMSTTYSSMHFGSHSAGPKDWSEACSKDGLVPLAFDTFRKKLLSLISNPKLSTTEGGLVFYIITPPSIMSLASPLLRQVFSAIKRALKTYSAVQVLFHLVPEYLVLGSIEHPAAFMSDIQRVCCSVYHRVLLPVDRQMSRRFFEHGEPIRSYFEEPAFTLARPAPSRVKFNRQPGIRALDVLDRHTLFHVGYQVSPCGKWLLAACIDQRGEAHDLGVWLTQGDSNEVFAVNQVWNFAVQFARKANVEWRIAFAKLGPMSSSELDVWIQHLSSRVPACKELPMVQVSLLSVDPDSPWTVLTPAGKPFTARPRSASKDPSATLFVDASARMYSSTTSVRMALSLVDPHCTLKSDLCFVPDDDDAPPCEHASILPLATTTLVRVPANQGFTAITMLQVHLLHTIKSPNSSWTLSDAETHKDITTNYHELTVLSNTRWQLDANPILPFHLAAVETMRTTLLPGDANLC